MKLAEVLSDFRHHYDDRDAIAFTGQPRSRGHLSGTIFDVLAVALTPIRKPRKPKTVLSVEDLIPGDFPIRRPRVLSPEALERRQRCQEERADEKAFLKHELATADADKFLDILEREKAWHIGVLGSVQKTWIYVEYKGKRLIIGAFEWMVGDSRLYLRFIKRGSTR